MASIVRANPHLEEIISILDLHLLKYGGDREIARDRLLPADNEWIDNEIGHCITDARYFISNYFAYRDEKAGFKGLYPFFDSQEILFEEYRKLERKYGKVRAMVLKARQMGSTTYNCAEYFHKTIWTEHANSMIVGQHEKQAKFIMGMYESALDFLPWWMKPRIKAKETGSVINFDEPDERMREIRPGLKSWVYADNANKPSGVGRGMTFKCVLMSELAFWDNAKQLSKSLIPTMNSEDGFYIMESTANGRNDAWHNLWRQAESGQIDFHPIFIPFYRREKTYSTPIPHDEEFKLSEDETEMRERIYKKEKFLIKDETFNWMRKRKSLFRATDGDDSMFYQEYTSEAEESFQASAITAFPRQIINRMSKRTIEPKWIGEIGFDFQQFIPKLWLNELGEREEAPYPRTENRLHVWKKPEKGAKYCVGVDVALGGPGGDYSCAQVLLKGEGIQKDEQVACWHGLIHPEALAKIVLALCWWYNEALAAVEVNTYGTQTNSILVRDYEYENVYLFKRLDRLKNPVTNIMGFWSDYKSVKGLMAAMSGSFLDDTIIINDKYTMDEYNDYTEEGAEGDGAHDDMVDALMIALFCMYEGEAKDRREGKRGEPENRKDTKTVQNKHIVKDRFGTIVCETMSRVEAERVAKIHIGSTTTRLAGATAHVTIAGQKRKVPADYQNTEFSPIHDKQGAAARLYEDEDVAAENITPELIAEYEAQQEQNENDPDAWLWS